MDWFPWQPLDSKGSLDGVQVTGYAYPHVHWTDSHGVNGSSNIEKGEGKLPGGWTGLRNGASTPSPASPSAKTTVRPEGPTTPAKKLHFSSATSRPHR